MYKFLQLEASYGGFWIWLVVSYRWKVPLKYFTLLSLTLSEHLYIVDEIKPANHSWICQSVFRMFF